MTPRHLLLILLAAALALPIALHAQTEKRQLRSLSLGSTTFPKLWAMDGTHPVAISFSTIQPSEPLSVNGANPLRIFMGELNDKGLPAATNFIPVELPAVSSILLLGWMVNEKPRFFPIPDPFATARSDDWLAVNATTRPVAIQIGAATKPTTVKPSSHAPIRVTAPANQGAAVIVATPSNNIWKTIYSTYWPIYADKRCLVIIVEDGSKTRVKVISDEFKKPTRTAL